MIWIGIDDTDMPDTRGTNQLARDLARHLAERYRCRRIVRHQLSTDPAIPCTSKNGSASLWLEAVGNHDRVWLIDIVRTVLHENYVVGSDPGLCVAEEVPGSIVDFGRRAQREIVMQSDARLLARQHGIHLEGLGGTEGGVIGALAAVGLGATRDDGRIIQSDQSLDELSGITTLAALALRGVLVQRDDGQSVLTGTVDVGKKLRPNCRNGKIVLTVVPARSPVCDYTALKLT